MNIEEAITSSRAHLASLASLTFPGVLILEVVFDKGLFSGNTFDLYGFILYWIWAIAISYAFTFVPWFLTHSKGLVDIDEDESASTPQVLTFCLPVVMVSAICSAYSFKMLLAHFPTLREMHSGIYLPHVVILVTSTVFIIAQLGTTRLWKWVNIKWLL